METAAKANAKYGGLSTAAAKSATRSTSLRVEMTSLREEWSLEVGL
jgi:hypothetical protein